MLLLFLLSCEFAPKTRGVSVVDATNATIAEVVSIGAATVDIVVAAVLVPAIVVASVGVVIAQTLVQG